MRTALIMNFCVIVSTVVKKRGENFCVICCKYSYSLPPQLDHPGPNLEENQLSHVQLIKIHVTFGVFRNDM